jgi:hypothetical protein
MEGGDGVRETFRYHRPDGQLFEIQLVDGKVTALRSARETQARLNTSQ